MQETHDQYWGIRMCGLGYDAKIVLHCIDLTVKKDNLL